MNQYRRSIWKLVIQGDVISSTHAQPLMFFVVLLILSRVVIAECRMYPAFCRTLPPAEATGKKYRYMVMVD